MKKQYTSPYNPAVKKLSDYIIERANDGLFDPDTLAKITPVLEGIEFTDHLLVQKDQLLLQKERLLSQKEIEKEYAIRSKSVEKNNLLLQKEQLLVQKEKNLEELTKNGVIDARKEFIDNVHASDPVVYSANAEKWSNDLPMKVYLNVNYVEGMVKFNKDYKEKVKKLQEPEIKQEFIDNLHALHPKVYPANFNEWTDDLPMKGYVDQNYIAGMKANNIIYKKQLAELKDAEFKRLKYENLYKEEVVARLKELLRIEKLEKEELFAQKEAELHEKSFVKNEIIEDLAETVALKDARINDLQLLNEELSHIPVGIQMTGNEIGIQFDDINLVGDSTENFH